MRQFIDIIAEGSSTGTAIFYHGTSSKFTDEIKANGLRPDAPDRVYTDGKAAMGGVYLAVSPDWALDYAKAACEKFGGQPIVYHVEADWDDLRMDEDVLYMAAENVTQDADTPQEMADLLMHSYGFTVGGEQLLHLCDLVHGGAEFEDPEVQSLLGQLIRVIPAQPIDPEDEPDYQVHYGGVIGWTGSPRIVGVT